MAKQYFIDNPYTSSYNIKTRELCENMSLWFLHTLVTIDPKKLAEWLTKYVDELNKKYPRCKTLTVRTSDFNDTYSIIVDDGGGNSVFALSLRHVQRVIDEDIFSSLEL